MGERIFRMKSEAVSDDLVESEGKSFAISEIPCEFPLISSSVFYEVIAVMLIYRKFCARLLPKLLRGALNGQRMTPVLFFMS
jgi:hypothetical protein